MYCNARGMGVIGTGSYLPTRVVTNDDIEATVSDFDRVRAGASLDDWLATRAGIRSRRRCAPGEGTAAMATEAIRRAMDDACVHPDELDLIVLSTYTSDHRLPQSVSDVQAALGTSAKCIQLEAACMGFIDGLIVAEAVASSSNAERVAVCHVEAQSAVCDPSRFLMQSIFGDGAGAVILGALPGAEMLGFVTCSDGHEGRARWLRAGGGTLSEFDRVPGAELYFTMNHHAIFGFAVDKMVEGVLELAERCEFSVDDIDWLIAHQTGANIISAVTEKLGLAPERSVLTIEHTGNTSGATIPIALDAARRGGLLAPGQLVVLPAVGAGMAWGAAALRWGDLGSPPRPAIVAPATLAEVASRGRAT
jgi:3-oxoacyl-[acyl-carrier-protein] synthase-3